MEINHKFRTITTTKKVLDVNSKEHEIEIHMFDPPLTFVKGRGYVQLDE